MTAWFEACDWMWKNFDSSDRDVIPPALRRFIYKQAPYEEIDLG